MGVGKRQAQCFDLQVQAHGREGRVGFEIKTLEQVKRQQSHQSLTVGRTLPQAYAMVIHPQRLVPGAVMGSQVIEGQAAARLLDGMGNGFGNLTLVKGSLATLRHPAQCAGQSWIAEHLSGLRAATIDGQLTSSQGNGKDFFSPVLPEIGGDGCNREAGLGQLDCRGKNFGELTAAVTLEQVAPPGTGPRDRDGVRVAGWKSHAKAFALDALQIQSSGQPTGAVQGSDTPSFR